MENEDNDSNSVIDEQETQVPIKRTRKVTDKRREALQRARDIKAEKAKARVAEEMQVNWTWEELFSGDDPDDFNVSPITSWKKYLVPLVIVGSGMAFVLLRNNQGLETSNPAENIPSDDTPMSMPTPMELPKIPILESVANLFEQTPDDDGSGFFGF